MKSLTVLLVLCCLALTGCGQKGPLVPPPPAKAQLAGAGAP